MKNSQDPWIGVSRRGGKISCREGTAVLRREPHLPATVLQRPLTRGRWRMRCVPVVRHCTFADTEAAPVIVNVHVFIFVPPLEQAPDQITPRPFDTVSVIDVPVVNVAEPVLPTATLIPAGLEVTPSPFRPVAVTDSVADCAGGGGGGGVAGGFTDSVAVLVAPPKAPPTVTAVAAVTAVVVTPKVALVAPAATVTLAGTPATIVLLLDNVTMAPPVGAAVVKVTVPVLGAPPTTFVGLTVTEDRVGAAGAGLTVSTAVRETAPKAPVIVSAVEDRKSVV